MNDSRSNSLGKRRMSAVPIFGNGMVLQRRKPIAVWGDSEADSQITVTLNGRETICTAASTGKWSVQLPPMEAATGLTMKISDHQTEIIFTDVAIGEVWLAGGQSNMEFLMKHEAERETVILKSENSNIRFYGCPQISYEGQLKDESHSFEGIWRKADPENTGYFSAVGYYFAQKISAYLKDIPVGIIGCYWGGSSAAAWMREEYFTDGLEFYLEERQSCKDALDIDKEFADFKKDRIEATSPEGRARSDNMFATPVLKPLTLEFPPEMIEKFKRTKFAPFSPFRPAGLVHTMLEKIVPYSVKGVIWYQGEEDVNHPDVYDKLFGRMIECWRELWNDKFPFIFAQLTVLNRMMLSDGNEFVPIRAMQERVSKTVPDTYMICTMDVGMEYDIHPKHKRPVGERMALQAIHHVYGGEILSESPEVAGASKEDGRISVKLLHCGDGLCIHDNKVDAMRLVVNGKEQKIFSVSAEGNTLIVACPAIRGDSRIELSYAQVGFCIVNIFNSAGIPVRPFQVIL